MKTWTGAGEENQEEVERKWWLVDASGKSLGRLSTQIASILRGKHKPQFSPHQDHGDFVVVINANKITMTGSKWTTKKFYRHSRYFGSLKEFSAQEMLEKEPCFLIEEAVEGMLPNNKLARRLLDKLKAYPDAQHPHAAQKPESLSL